MITTNLDEYSERALELAQDKGKLAAIRGKLADNREAAPLFNSTRYTRNLERCFETMVDIKRAGEMPRPFAVVETETPKIPHNPTPPREASPVLREMFDGCPLCSGRETSPDKEARITNHRLYNTILPSVLKWRRCSSCEHVFTEGYLTTAGSSIVHAVMPPEISVGKDAENGRKASAKIAERVTRYVAEGEWLDIGFGNASRIFTAAEWGFRAVGIDSNEGSVEKLRRFGYEAYRSLEELTTEGRFSAVSMIDGLDRLPFPGRTLESVHRMMRVGGALILSMPNRDTIVWRALDATGTNPYWADLERYHSFTRARLARLLTTCGFKLVEYRIDDDQRSGMEVLALKAATD